MPEDDNNINKIDLRITTVGLIVRSSKEFIIESTLGPMQATIMQDRW
jgi:hypothetical protein